MKLLTFSSCCLDTLNLHVYMVIINFHIIEVITEEIIPGFKLPERWIWSTWMKYIFIDTCGRNIYKFKRQNYHGDIRWKCCGCCYHLTDFEPFPLNHWRSVLNELWCTIHLLASMQEQIWCRNRILPDYYLCICYICYLCVWACVYTCILLLFMHILTDILLTEG